MPAPWRQIAFFTVCCDVEVERVAELVRLVLVRVVVADARALRRRGGRRGPSCSLRKRSPSALLADGPDAAGRELEPALALLDEPGLLEHLRQLARAARASGPRRRRAARGPGRGRPRRARRAGSPGAAGARGRRCRRACRAGPASAPSTAGRRRGSACDRSHGRFGNACCRLRDELVDLPAQVHVLEQRLGERLELRALLGRHRVHELLHLRHRLRHLLEQLVERLRVAGEEVAVALHEARRSRAPRRARAARASG